MKCIIVIMVIVLAAFAKHHHRSLRKSFLKGAVSTRGLFDKLNIMERIFKHLNLANNFTEGSNVKMLLTMYYDLTNIAGKNLETFEEILNITAIDSGNRTDSTARLDEVVKELMEENNYDVYNQIRGKNHKHKHEKNTTRKNNDNVNDTFSDFENSSEFMDFVVDFWEKVNNLSAKDFQIPKLPEIRIVPARRNLKVWDPPDSLEILRDVNNSNARRVYMGSRTDVKKYPFIVSIHIMGEFACSGSIISRDLIITAASCLEIAYNNEFFKQNSRSIYVRIGSDYTMKHGETIPVQEIYFHPTYKPETLRHNLAMVRLEKRIRFTRQQTRIRRILWDTQPESLGDINDGIVILGWGSKQANQKVKKSQKLAVDTLDVYPLNDCKDIYSRKFVSDEHFCAGFLQASGGACNGDIGGPGIIGAELVGIVSFGAPTCGSVDAPTVFTKLGFYTPWIEGIMGPTRSRQDSLSYSRRRSRFHKHKSSHVHSRKHKLQKSQRIPKPTKSNQQLLKKKRVQFRGDEYPDEVKVLREILTELVQSDSAVVDELLYGELYEDFNDLFAGNDNEALNQLSASNNSVYVPNLNSLIENDKNQDFIETDATSSYITPPTTMVVPKHNQQLRDDEYKHQSELSSGECGSVVYTDNYESSCEERGLSIEIISTEPTPEQKLVTENYEASSCVEDSLESKKKESTDDEKDSVLDTSSSEKISESLDKNIQSQQDSQSEKHSYSDKQSRASSDELLLTDELLGSGDFNDSDTYSSSESSADDPKRQPKLSSTFFESHDESKNSGKHLSLSELKKKKTQEKLRKGLHRNKHHSKVTTVKTTTTTRKKEHIRKEIKSTANIDSNLFIEKDFYKSDSDSDETTTMGMQRTILDFMSVESRAKYSPYKNLRAKIRGNMATKPYFYAQKETTLRNFMKPWRELKGVFSIEI